MHVKWSDYLTTVLVRAIAGFIGGVLVGLLLAFFGTFMLSTHPHVRRESPLVETTNRGQYWVLIIWFIITGAIGALIAVLTIPRCETPWYKSILDEEDDSSDDKNT